MFARIIRTKNNFFLALAANESNRFCCVCGACDVTGWYCYVAGAQSRGGAAATAAATAAKMHLFLITTAQNQLSELEIYTLLVVY